MKSFKEFIAESGKITALPIRGLVKYEGPHLPEHSTNNVTVQRHTIKGENGELHRVTTVTNYGELHPELGRPVTHILVHDGNKTPYHAATADTDETGKHTFAYAHDLHTNKEAFDELVSPLKPASIGTDHPDHPIAQIMNSVAEQRKKSIETAGQNVKAKTAKQNALQGGATIVQFGKPKKPQ